MPWKSAKQKDKKLGYLLINLRENLIHMVSEYL